MKKLTANCPWCDSSETTMLSCSVYMVTVDKPIATHSFYTLPFKLLYASAFVKAGDENQWFNGGAVKIRRVCLTCKAEWFDTTIGNGDHCYTGVERIK